MVRYFGFSVALTVAAFVTAVVLGGPAGLLAVAVLSVLEVCLSFDNAVVNAKVLKTMTPFWRKMFLFVGIFIAVFGVRLVLPILLVSLTAGLGFGEVVDLALNDAATYGAYVEDSAEAIFAFGGTFLLLVFLGFVLDTEGEKEHDWLVWLERPLARLGQLPGATVLVAALYIVLGSRIAEPEKSATVLFAGLMGLIVYYAVQMLSTILEKDDDEEQDESAGPVGSPISTKAVASAGLGAFLYLEVLDASFSFDGVIGAFAISNNILVILLGLGVGAFWVRSLTIFMVDRGTLDAYRFLEHGAMWAIGFLACIMFAELRWHVSEYVTGLTGVLFIVAAVISSVAATRREAQGAGAHEEKVSA